MFFCDLEKSRKPRVPKKEKSVVNETCDSSMDHPVEESKQLYYISFVFVYFSISFCICMAEKNVCKMYVI